MFQILYLFEALVFTTSISYTHCFQWIVRNFQCNLGKSSVAIRILNKWWMPKLKLRNRRILFHIRPLNLLQTGDKLLMKWKIAQDRWGKTRFSHLSDSDFDKTEMRTELDGDQFQQCCDKTFEWIWTIAFSNYDQPCWKSTINWCNSTKNRITAIKLYCTKHHFINVSKIVMKFKWH